MLWTETSTRLVAELQLDRNHAFFALSPSHRGAQGDRAPGPSGGRLPERPGGYTREVFRSYYEQVQQNLDEAEALLALAKLNPMFSERG